MKKLFMAVSLFLFSACSFSVVSDITLKFQNVTTDYFHAGQEASLAFQAVEANNITINFGDEIVIKYSVLGPQVIEGITFLNNQAVSVNHIGNQFNFRFTLNKVNPFMQENSYQITMDTDAGIGKKSITYNKEFVVTTFSIQAKEDYFYINANEIWLKGGLSVLDESGNPTNLVCTGTIGYKYDNNIAPAANQIFVRLFNNGQHNGSGVYTDVSGNFIISNFSVPLSASGVSENFPFEIKMPYDELEETQGYRVISVNIDNQSPALNQATLIALEDMTDNGSDGIFPLDGWYDQNTVDVVVSAHVLILDAGSGLSQKAWYVTDYASQLLAYGLTQNVRLNNGAGKNISVYVLDNVGNRSTLSVVVSIDSVAPEVFSVYLDQDKDNLSYQVTPEIGWYNDETISISWLSAYDSLGLRQKPYQVKSSVGTNVWSAKSEGMLLADAFQSELTVAILTVNHGGLSPRSYYVRAVDKAGNVRVVEGTVYVDTIAPTINNLTLHPDRTPVPGTTFPELPAQGWYNDSSVRWSWSVADDAAMPEEEKYQYRNKQGILNTSTSNWSNISDIYLETSEALTGNTFWLRVRDKAGNTRVATANVFVDITPPVFGNFKIVAVTDDTDNNNDGVLPNPKWYDQLTLNMLITWDAAVEEGQLWKLFLMQVDKWEYVSQNVSLNLFENVQVAAPKGRVPIQYVGYIMDKAGNMYSNTEYIYCDIEPPGPVFLSLIPDTDSGGDGIVPEIGWYDDVLVNLEIIPPLTNVNQLRNSPYQLKVNENEWGLAFSDIRNIVYEVSSNQHNIVELRCINEAGIVSTASIRVTVDLTIPSVNFDFELLPDTQNIQGDQVTPNVGWYNDRLARVSFANVDISENVQLSDLPFKVLNMTDSRIFSSQLSSNIVVSVNPRTEQQSLFGSITDKAGNVVQKEIKVYVDTEPPNNNFVINIQADQTDFIGNGYSPEVGWYDQEYVDLNWGAASDVFGRLADNPYRLRASGVEEWTSFQSMLSYLGLYAPEAGNQTVNIYVQASDMAGNLTTVNAYIKVDKTAPTINNLSLEQLPTVNDSYLIEQEVFLPLPNWFNASYVTLNWTGGVTDNGELRDLPYKVKASVGSTDWSALMAEEEYLIYVGTGNITTVDLFLFVLDRAGNSQVSSQVAYLDLQSPEVTVFMKSDNEKSHIPYVHTADILTLTINVSEPAVVTPFFAYYPTNNLDNPISFVPWRDGEEWVVTFQVPEDIVQERHNFIIKAYDSAGNVNDAVFGNSFFVMAENIPSVNGFKVFDLETENEDLTNKTVVGVTFNVVTPLEKYFATEINFSKDSLTEGNFILVEDNLSFTLSSPQGEKRVYLWVRDVSGNISIEAISTTILLDSIAPKISIKPNKNEPTILFSSGSNFDTTWYDNVKIGAGIYEAAMEVEHYSPAVWSEVEYEESLRVTPEWLLDYFNEDGNILTTITLNPQYLQDDSIWVVTYDTTLYIDAAVTGQFRVVVTDNAYNVTTNIFRGEKFSLDKNLPKAPLFEIYSLDGRSEYTNQLEINFIVTKNQEEDVYVFYKIVDGISRIPNPLEIDIPWPVEATTVSDTYRIEAGFDENDVAEGVKTIRVWVKNEFGRLNESLVEHLITFDRTPPSWSLEVQEAIGIPNEEIRVTVFLTELLDSVASQTIYLTTADGVSYFDTQLEHRGVELIGNIRQQVYVGNLEIPEELVNNQKYISIDVTDLAGNRLSDRLPFMRVCTVLTYNTEHESFYIERDDEILYPILSFVISADDRDVALKGVKLKVYNQGYFLDDDIYKVMIFKDTLNDGQFMDFYDTEKIGEVVFNNSLLDENGILSLPFIAEQNINKAIASRYFVVIQLYEYAEVGHVIEIGFPSENTFVVGSYDQINYSLVTENFKTQKISIQDLISKVALERRVILASPINTQLRMGQQNVLLDRMNIYTNQGTAILKSLKLKFNGYFDPNKLTLKIYRNMDVNYDFGEIDIERGLLCQTIAGFDNNKEITLDLSAYEVEVNNQQGHINNTFFLVADIDKDLETGFDTRFSLEVVSTNYFAVATPNNIWDRGYPYRITTFNVGPYLSQVSVNVTLTDENYVYPNSSILLAKVKLEIDYYNAQQVNPALNSFKINYCGEGLASEVIHGFKLYAITSDLPLETIDFSSYNPLNSLGNYWSNNVYNVSLTSPYAMVTCNYLILVADIQNGADGANFTLSIPFEDKPTTNPKIIFSNAEIISSQTISLNNVQVLGANQPTKPVITGNFYIASALGVSVNISSTANNGTQIYKFNYSIGSTLGGFDLAANKSIIISESTNLINYPLCLTLDASKSFVTSRSYYLSLRSIAKENFNSVEYFSVSSNYSFVTDFSPPFATGTLPYVESDSLSVTPYHLLYWFQFREDESKVNRYIIERQEEGNMRWRQVTISYVADFANVGAGNSQQNIITDVLPNVAYKYRIQAINEAGLASNYVYTPMVSIVRTNQVISNVSNYPNPFYPRSGHKTKISFYLNQSTGVEISIYDSMGHLARKMSIAAGIDGQSKGGQQCEIEWDGKNEAGQYVAKGGYFAVIETPFASGQNTRVVRMIGVIN